MSDPLPPVPQPDAVQRLRWAVTRRSWVSDDAFWTASGALAQQ